ncbi:MAG TPA: response regulator [Edaphobacter sp.]|nr:response regulator [Edaphobacter sp.]
MKRRILLVDDEVAVLLTMKAILEISGFEVDTAASGREGKSKLHTREYHMVITDMRMENDEAGVEVIQAARSAHYHPAIALLTAFPVADEDWQEMGADKMLVKPLHVRILLEQIEHLLKSHEVKLAKLGIRSGAQIPAAKSLAKKAAKTTAKPKKAAKTPSTPKKSVKKAAVKVIAKKSPAKKSSVKKTPLKKVAKKRT